MNSFKNPLVPLIANPVNIDRPIQDLQQQLATLGWLERSFGRAYESRVSNPASNKISVYPQVWQGLGMDLLNVMPNDNLSSQSFFKVEDPIEVERYERDGNSFMRARVSIIFWYNLKRIDNTIDYSYGELLKGSAQRIITNAQFQDYAGIEIVKVWETAKNVFAGYSIDEVAQQELIYPYGGFRFECLMRYTEDCPDSVYQLPQ